MELTATLQWRATCENCENWKNAPENIIDWFGIWDEDDLDGSEAIYRMELDGWTFHRESYEDLVPYCPKCSKERNKA
jgi:hypothetical protein